MGRRSTQDVLAELSSLRQRIQHPVPVVDDYEDDDDFDPRVSSVEDALDRFDGIALRMEAAVDLFQALVEQLLDSQTRMPRQERKVTTSVPLSEDTEPFYTDEGVQPVKERFLMDAIASSRPLDER